MSKSCAVTACKRTSCALCYCCQQSVCFQHLKEHNDSLVLQFDPLVDQIKDIGDRLKSIDVESKINDCRQKLEQWRMNCHKKIDDFFEQKYQEINQHIREEIDKQREEINRIQSKIAILMLHDDVTRQDIDLLSSTIQKLDEEVNKIEQRNFYIETRPVLVDDSLAIIKELSINRFDQSKMSPVCKTISYTSGSSVSIASNERVTLMQCVPDLCLIDQTFNILYQTKWNNGEIRNMCWSSTLDRFIITSEQGVFSLREKPMSVDKLLTVSNKNWFGCTCSDTSLFLSTYTLASSITEYSLLPVMEIITEREYPFTCSDKEYINDMKYSNGSLALLISNMSGDTVFIELRNIQTFDCFWSCQVNCAALQNRAFHCCLLNKQEWLVMDHDSDQLIHITKDGKIKSSYEYKGPPWCATMFGPDTIAISTTKGVNFHKLS